MKKTSVKKSLEKSDKVLEQKCNNAQAKILHKYSPFQQLFQKSLKGNLKTYPVDCRKITAVEFHNSIGIERKEKIN